MSNDDPMWWAVSAERTLSEDVPAPPGAVRDFYVDLHNIRSVHPLVVSVRTIAREETADGYVQTYRVRDRIPLGPTRLPTSYVARLHVPVTGDVITQALQFPLIRLHSVVSFDQIDGHTRITERVHIQAPRFVAALTIREAEKAHIEMLANIKHHFA